MAFFILIPMAVISWLYRHELGGRGLGVYWGLWLAGLLINATCGLHPGFFVGFECLLTVAMLIQLGVNPNVPRY